MSAEFVEAALSREQQQALRTESRHRCLRASAGSGKTRTMVYALLNDLASGVEPDRIIAFTFTEKAAEELLARIHILASRHLKDRQLRGLYIGTIHRWCFQYLLNKEKYYNIHPLDELQTEALVTRSYDVLKIGELYGCHFPQGISRFRHDLELVQNEGLPPEKIPVQLRESLERFFKLCKENRLITFGGMINSAVEVLTTTGGVDGLRCLYVDEYQDVNPAQVRLCKAMLSEDTRLTVVGDELQCIYQWRGSDVERILKFREDFEDSGVSYLVQNYRSRPSIVDVANAVAESIFSNDKTKQMQAVRDASDGPRVHFIRVSSKQKQAESIEFVIRKLVRHGLDWSDIAVLCRSVRSHAGPVVEELERAGVPTYCPAAGRAGELVERFIGPVFEWLGGDLPEPRTKEEATKQERRHEDLWEGASQWVTRGEDTFWSALHGWRAQIDEGGSSAYNIRARLYEFLEEVGVQLVPSDSNLIVAISLVSQIIRSVEEVERRRLRDQKRRSPRAVTKEVYYTLKRRFNLFGEATPVELPSNAVMITTIHQAKGLEWPVVIVPQLRDGNFPVSGGGYSTSFPAEITDRYRTSVEDERRLFYVATTRAEEELFYLGPANKDSDKPSVFVRDLIERKTSLRSWDGDPNPEAIILNKSELRSGKAAPIRIGISDLLIYLECPYQYGLRRRAGIRPAIGDELGYGKSLHELLQRRFESGRPWDADQWSDQAEKHVHLPYTSKFAEARSEAVICERLNTLEAMGELGGEVATEVEVQLVLKEGVAFGTVDIIYRNNDGTLTVRDWKSSVHDRFVERYRKQVQLYVCGLRQSGESVAEAELVDIAASADEEKLVTRTVDIDEKRIEQLVSTCNLALANIRKGDFPATPGPQVCSACDVSQLCAERWDADEEA